jgi:carbon-monoxide dehydrogenase medium subunit
VAVSVYVVLKGHGGEVAKAGIGLTAVGPTNIKAAAAEKSLVGQKLSDKVIAEAARLAADAAEPKDDIRGTVAYKKDVVRVFVQRGLKTALARAQEVKA